MSDLPTPPDPLKVAQWTGQVRMLLPFIGGALAAVGVVVPSMTDAQLSGYVSAIMTLSGLATYAAGAAWSWYQKVKDRRALVASAVASAKMATPVVVTVTPEGQPNIATKVPVAEQMTAPTVPTGAKP